ncbi:MAG: hypothetical protein K2H64_04620 [Desulfovibrio sp.]|nr:hypothetical protein [Desulfovibrio sp.]
MPDIAGEIPASLIGRRLDAALAWFLPDLGLRGRRRLATDGSALVNGAVASPAYRMKRGDRISFLTEEKSETLPAPTFLGEKNKFFIFNKPAGLHTQELAGRPGASFERWTREWSASRPFVLAPPRLLQRLDFGTSGLILGSDEENCERFRDLEKKELCGKHYLAILAGEMIKPALASWALDTRDRRKTRLLRVAAPRVGRTEFTPLGVFGEKGRKFTLAVCRIMKGARHQIRAHAAALGYPLAGDDLYGAPYAPINGDNFYLRHFYLKSPLIKVFYYPDDLPRPDMDTVFRGFVESRGLQSFAI